MDKLLYGGLSMNLLYFLFSNLFKSILFQNYIIDLLEKNFGCLNSNIFAHYWNILGIIQKVCYSKNWYVWPPPPNITLFHLWSWTLSPLVTPLRVTNSNLKKSQTLGPTFAEICIFYSRNVLSRWTTTSLWF